MKSVNSSDAVVRIRAGQSQDIPADQRQGVGQNGYLVAMFLDVFGKSIAHQTPAGDLAHSAHQGEKFIGHGLLLVFG